MRAVYPTTPAARTTPAAVRLTVFFTTLPAFCTTTCPRTPPQHTRGLHYTYTPGTTFTQFLPGCCGRLLLTSGRRSVGRLPAVLTFAHVLHHRWILYSRRNCPFPGLFVDQRSYARCALPTWPPAITGCTHYHLRTYRYRITCDRFYKLRAHHGGLPHDLPVARSLFWLHTPSAVTAHYRCHTARLLPHATYHTDWLLVNTPLLPLHTHSSLLPAVGRSCRRCHTGLHGQFCQFYHSWRLLYRGSGQALYGLPLLRWFGASTGYYAHTPLFTHHGYPAIRLVLTAYA